MEELSEDEDFNRGLILPPLLVQLKKILEQYPDDTQILKVSSEYNTFTSAVAVDTVVMSGRYPDT